MPRRRDLRSVLAVAMVMATWMTWYLRPTPEGPVLVLTDWSRDAPRSVAWGELKAEAIAARSRRARLEREVRAARGILTGSPDDRQLRQLLEKTRHDGVTADAARLISYRNLPRSAPWPEPPVDRPPPLTARQLRIIEMAKVVEEAASLRGAENLLQALAASAGRTPAPEGFYSDFQVCELWILKTPAGYRVTFGGAYGQGHHGFAYDFDARWAAGELVGKSREGSFSPKEGPTTVRIRFDRGLASIDGDRLRYQTTLVKLAEIKDPAWSPDELMMVGFGSGPDDAWKARRQALDTEILWLSPARPSFVDCWQGFYNECDEALR